MPGGRKTAEGSSSLLTLHRLPAGHRVLYTGVLLLIVVGFGVGLAQQALRAGLSPAGVADWYLGNAGDSTATRLLFAMSREELLDRVWRRSLADLLPSVVLLALWFRASVARGPKRAVGAALPLVALADTATPLLAIPLGRAVGWVGFPAQTLLAALAALVASVCVWQMWVRRTAGPRTRARTARAPARVRGRSP